MRLRSLFCSFVLLLTLGFASQAWANSVDVSNSSLRYVPGLGQFETGNSVFDCAQSGVSSASCTSGSSSAAFPYVDSGGTASGSAAFGQISAGTIEGNAEGRAVSSFSDQVVVNGGSGTGTLVAHYSLVSEGEAYYAAPADFVFAQGGSKTSVEPSYQYFGGTPVPNPPPGCEYVGYCYSEAYDIATPVVFGAATALGAQLSVGTSGGTLIPPHGDTTAYASIMLNGYTVLDGAGKVVADAAVTRQNLPASFNLDFTPEPGTWGLMLMGLALFGGWRLRRRRALLFSVVGLVALGGAVPVFANSVFVSNTSDLDSSNPSFVVIGAPVTYCQQSGTSSAVCATGVDGRYGSSYVSWNGSVRATAAFGALSGSFGEFGSSGYFLASFGDEVMVTGGSGNGTLVTHYSLSSTADASLPEDGRAGRFSFVQGATKTGFVPTYTSLGFNAPYPPTPPGCNPYGQCFSENYDVTSAVQFGTALPLGAQVALNSDELPGRSFYGGVSTAARSMLQLTGYTVLDGSGNVVSDAVVTPQNVPGLDLFPAPEPGTWGLMLMGLAVFGGWRFRRRRGMLLSLMGLVAAAGAVPLRANSVSVTNFGPDGSQYPRIIVDGQTVPYCQQSSSSSASCMTSFGGHGGGYGYIDAGGNISASAAFGSLWGAMTEQGSDGRLLASFGDNVVVTGGSGAGTLVAHYSLVSEGEAYSPGSASYSFVQGGTRSSVNAAGNYVVNTGLPVTPPAPHCESIGFCFSESFDVSSPMQFGADLPLGAQMYVTSPDGTFFPPNGDVTGTASVDLTGYTVLDAGGNVVSDAVVTQQNVAGLDLFPAPEPGTWALMVMGLGLLAGWRLRLCRS